MQVAECMKVLLEQYIEHLNSKNRVKEVESQSESDINKKFNEFENRT